MDQQYKRDAGKVRYGLVPIDFWIVGGAVHIPRALNLAITFVQVDRRLRWDEAVVACGAIEVSLPQIIAVMEKGLDKYEPHSWHKAPNAWDRYMDSLVRHTLAHYQGEELDPDSGLPHLWHIGANLVILADLSS